MVDELEEQSSEGLDLRRYLGILKRRHLHFLIPLFVGWVVVWAASWILPPRYQSTTLILVEEPAMPKDYVKPNVSDDLQDRLQSITQQILSRSNLLPIINQFHLYSRQHAEPADDDKVAQMRKDINIELVRDAHNQQITAFNVSYTSRSPFFAQQVAGDLTNLFIDRNLQVRQQQSKGTTQFLEAQLEDARKDLAAQEDKIRQFKGQHVGEMPGQLTSNLQILQGLQTQLQTEEDGLNAARQQRVYLQTLADQYRATLGGVKNSDGTPVGLPAIDGQLQKLRAQLADLSSRYTDRHPDVRKLKEEIAKDETLRVQVLAAMENKTSDAGADASSATPDTTQVTMLAPIESQLRSNQLEITNREHAIATLKTRVEDYQTRLNQEPVREQQLADLTRGYDQSRANYDDLLKKKNESSMATSMELLQQGERFRVVDPPSLPQKPEFPNRLKFCEMGLGIGLLLGVVVAGAFEMFDGRLQTAKELKKLLPIEVIGEIPIIETVADLNAAKWKVWAGWATAAFVFATILVGSAFSFLRG